MADARCPEPKPVFIALASALGAVALVLSNFILDQGRELTVYAVEGGGFGCAIGVGVAISKLVSVRIIVGSILIVPSILPGLFLEFVPEGQDALNRVWIVFIRILGIVALIGIPLAISMLLSHQLMLKRNGTWKYLPVFIAGGMGSAMVSWVVIIGLGFHGAVSAGPILLRLVVLEETFGIPQYLAMLAALSVDRKLRLRPEPPPSAPSPGPGP